MPKLRVVIVGGGIGGLTAAIILRRAGCEVQLFERAPEIRPIGAGISLWPNGARIMHHLGIGPELESLAPHLRSLRYLAPDGQVLRHISLAPMVKLARQRPLPIVRTDLQRVLFEHVGPEPVGLECECVGVRQEPGSAMALFANGDEATGDLVLGADGIHSVVRSHVVGEPAPAVYVGNMNWNGLIHNPGDELGCGASFDIGVGDNKRWGMMPVGGGQVYFFFDAPVPNQPMGPDGWRAELASLYEGWERPVGTLIERFETERAVRQPIFEVGPIDSSVRGRVALLGDAAHGTTPTIGQGASQAMEDGIVLARCLEESGGEVEPALLRYHERRHERVREVAAVSRRRTDLMMGVDREATSRWYEELRAPAAADRGDVVDPLTRIAASGPL